MAKDGMLRTEVKVIQANKPRVAIITTVHDLEPYIGKYIPRVLDQAYQNLEQVILD